MQPQAPNTPQASDYDFIVNPQQPGAGKPPGLPSLPGGNSLIGRVLVISGGLIILLIIFAVLKSLLLKGPDYSGFITAVEDQQELIHLATNAQQQQDISTINDNFAATAALSVASSQTQMIAYLTSNGQKIATNMLNLKVSSSLDTQLTAAAADTTYDSTFQQIIQSQLSDYFNDLNATLKKTTGTKGRALLSSDAAQAQLLYNQLSSPEDQ